MWMSVIIEGRYSAIGQWLSERLARQFVIDNRPGAGGSAILVVATMVRSSRRRPISNIFPKKVILTYMVPIVAVRL
jgi:hypothetical protein